MLKLETEGVKADPHAIVGIDLALVQDLIAF